MKLKNLGKTLLVGALALTITMPAFAQTNSSEKGGTVALQGEPSEITPYTVVSVDNGNGEWDYGTRLTVTTRKKVWSNLDHRTKTHKSKVEIDGKTDDSGWKAPRIRSKADKVGSRKAIGYASWEVK